MDLISGYGNVLELAENWPKLGNGNYSELNKQLYEFTRQLAVEVCSLKISVQKLEAEKINLETKIQEKDSLINDFKITSQKGLWSSLLSEDNSNIKTTAPLLAIVAKERNEAHNKENNIIITGLKESNKLNNDEKKKDDDLILEGLLDALQIKKIHVKRSFRLKKKDNDKPAALLIEFKIKETQVASIQNAKKLKDIPDYKQVYINKDLTINELEINKALRAERDDRNEKLTLGEGRLKFGTDIKGREFYWGIRWGSLYKINKITKRILTAQ